MVYFLERIAQHLYSQNGTDLQRHCLVFPNRRAGLSIFLNTFHGKLKNRLDSCNMATVKEFFISYSDLNLVETEILLCELYKVYRKLNISQEVLMSFISG
jgi:hypothetical protein